VIDDPEDFLNLCFEELLKDYNSGELPPVEVKTDKFRAVAQKLLHHAHPTTHGLEGSTVRQ